LKAGSGENSGGQDQRRSWTAAAFFLKKSVAFFTPFATVTRPLKAKRAAERPSAPGRLKFVGSCEKQKTENEEN
jgi:hypothetical protein